MPDGKVSQRPELREILVVEKHQALENVPLDPEVCVDVERLNDTSKRRAGFKKPRLNLRQPAVVCATQETAT